MAPIFALIDAPIIFVIGAVVLILFGAERLPKLARAMGEAKKEFDSGVRPPPANQPLTSVPPAPPAEAASARPPSEPAAPGPGSQTPGNV
jgi:sec-independent protein translocase protein TatA